MPDRDAHEQHSARLPTGLLRAGVGLAPIVVLLVLLGDGGGSLRFATVLLAVGVVLIGASLLIRKDPVLSRMDIEDRVAKEITALREELREEIVAAVPRPSRPMTPPPMTAPPMTAPPMPAMPVATAAVPVAPAASQASAGQSPRPAGTAQVPRPAAASAQVPRPAAASAQVPRPAVASAAVPQQRAAAVAPVVPLPARAAASVRPMDDNAPAAPSTGYPPAPAPDDESPVRSRRRRRAADRADPEPDGAGLDPSAWLAEPDGRWGERAYDEQPGRRHRAADDDDAGEGQEAYPPQGRYGSADHDVYGGHDAYGAEPEVYPAEADYYPVAAPAPYAAGEHDDHGPGQPEHYDVDAARTGAPQPGAVLHGPESHGPELRGPELRGPESPATRRSRHGAAPLPPYPEADEYGRW